jgi:GR25 family glycosyltransferase involved in LPS biosynthesis
MEDGNIGCSMSHIECLNIAIKNNWSHVVIVEDDITFIKPEVFIDSLNNFLNNNTLEWDVLILGGVNSLPYDDVNEYCIKVNNCQTTTGYLVKRDYYTTLLNNFKQGLDNLMKLPGVFENQQKFAIDQYWKNLQKKDDWYMLKPLSVIQKPNFSDIVKGETDYTNMMT